MIRLLLIAACVAVALAVFSLPLQAAPAAPAAVPAAPAAAPAAAPTAPAATPAAPVEKVAATVKLVEGTVETRPAVGQPWTAVKVGQSLAEGADLRTGFRARCIVDLTESTIQVDALTVVRIGVLEKQGNTVKTRIIMKHGSTQANVEKERVKSDFAIVMPWATCSVRGTEGIMVKTYPNLPFQFALLTNGLIEITDPTTGAYVLLQPTQYTNSPTTQPIDYLAWVLAMHMPGSTLAYSQDELLAAHSVQ